MRLSTLAITFMMALATSAQTTEVMMLSGHGPKDAVKWDFRCTDGMRAGEWSQIDVPSCWEQQGFGGYTYGRYYIYDRESEKKWADYREHAFTQEEGLYRRQFEVPKQWKNRRVSIVFDGVMTDAEVKLNGMLAGPVHQGGFYRFRYDISDKLQYGKRNTIEVKVSKQSADKSVNAAERRADWWLFGGIYRPVWIEAKPQTHIEHIAIDARADGTLRADLRCKNLHGDELLEMTIQRKGDPLASGRRLISLKAAEQQTIETSFDGIRPWDTEHPNLYRLTLRLLSDGRNIHETEETVGFRTIEFRPHDGIYLNDTKLLVKGTNRHCFDPETGRTLTHARNLQDARLIKQMNMNAVRSHYPPDADFLNLCDSLGILYLDELAGWQNSYSTEVGSRLLKEMVDRDVNHPCIFLWSNGNEGGFNTAFDPLFAQYDPQHRHVVHPWADFDGLDCRHYPTAKDQAYRLDHGQQVFMMTEFLHGLYDRGQGAGLEGLWHKFRRSRLFAGGFIWAYVDEAVHRTDNGLMDTYGPNAPDGIVSAERQPLGSFFTVRQVWSPIQIKDFEAGGSFRGRFQVDNEYLFSNLDECAMRWQVLQLPEHGERMLAEGDVTLPDIGPGERGTARFSLPADYLEGDLLRLEAYDAKGDTVCTWTFPIKRPKDYFAQHRNSEKKLNRASVVEHDAVIELAANGMTATLSKTSGMLVSLKKGDTLSPLANGPLPVGMKAELRELRTEQRGDTAVVVAKYDGAADSIVWRMTPDGLLGLDALVLNWRTDNRMKGSYVEEPCYNLGFSFSYDEASVSGMRWMGRGPYRVWKNRIPGANLGLWQKDYNNTVTGEYYYPQVYPEFKGYHADLYWATLQSETSLPLTVYTETDGLFFRVFTAEEQRDREGRGHSVPQWPEGDLSFLLEIPAVNSQGTDGEPGSVKVRRDDAGYHIRLWFRL